MAAPVIVEQRGSFLLIRRDHQFAVVERRGGHIYSLHDGIREPYPEAPSGIAAAVGRHGWQDEAEARRTFKDLVQRGEQLAQRLR
jgi:hypothetical protein